MPAIIRPATHPPRRWKPRRGKAADTPDSLFQLACKEEHAQSRRLIRSSFFFPPSSSSYQSGQERTISPDGNGLVHACFSAYSGHHHLTLRPQDVWFAILSQFSFYVNRHAERLRYKFVAHEGKKEIIVTGGGTLFSADYPALTGKITEEMEKHIVDAEMKGWIYPDDLSGTTDEDRVVAGVLMMGTMQKYFEFKMMLVCGIPSVTLLGEKEDWEKLVGRLDKLEKGGFGEEVEDWVGLLRVVLGYFVKSFDDPEGGEVVDFWSKIAHKESGGSGPTYLSGWLTAFCFWNAEGESMYQKPQGDEEWQDPRNEPFSKNAHGCIIDGTVFHRVDTDEIPVGYTSVPVTVDDNGTEHKTKMVAGSIGVQGWSSGEYLDEPEPSKNGFVAVRRNGDEPDTSRQVTGLDSIQPMSGWMMYELKDEQD